ncbi:MAG: hypothetical protein KGM47_14285 [Acidobacteriota bacterium]|nr:hypothetical protein [Acidobacteriota bacterium]
MSKRMPLYFLAVCLGLSLPGYADFKYAETSQVTGGAMAGAMKAMGIFSKSARQATKPMEGTTYVKGDHLRRDSADGTYQIIDLGGQQIIQVDPAHQTYSVFTFQQMRDAVQKMEQNMNSGMRQAREKEKGNNVTMTPKIDINPTGRTQTILGQNAQEVQMKVEMLFQSTDSQQQAQSGSFTTDVDSWVAPSVAGYGEVNNFYKKMAQEINWSPNAAFGTNPNMMKSMAELYKSGKIPSGLPMLVTTSMTAAGQPGAQGAQQQQQPEPQQQSSSTSSDITNPSAAAAKALGGMFGGFGRRHKKQKEENAEAPAAPAPPGSLLTITTRVSSYSTDPVDSSLFQVPAGYTRVQSDIERMLQGEH